MNSGKRSPRFATGTGFCVLTLLALLAVSQPAQAQMVTFDPTMYATQLLQKIQAAWSAATNSLGQYMQSLVQTKIADSQRQADRMNVHAKTAEEIAAANTLPIGYSACQHERGAAAAAFRAKTMAKLVLNSSQMACVANPSNNALMIKNRLDLGLAPCSGATSTGASDPDYNSAKDFKCQQKWGGRWENTDTNPGILFSDMQFPVPSNFQLPISGICQMMQVPTDEKYMPFIAAYSYCQSINNQIPQGKGATSTATTASLGLNARARMRARLSGAYTQCMKILWERAQVGTSVSALSELHTKQSDGCDADAKVKWFDNNASCSSDGRSEIERRFNLAYREFQNSYSKGYMATADVHDILNEKRSIEGEQRDFDSYLESERQSLNAAIGASDNAPSTGSDVLSAMPVQQ